VVSATIRAIAYTDKAMTPEQEQALKTHLQAVAKILYEDSDPDTMQTLEGIEMTVRQKIQAHVGPELGIFLLERLQEQQQAEPEP
jgi:hypothetical protein